MQKKQLKNIQRFLIDRDYSGMAETYAKMNRSWHAKEWKTFISFIEKESIEKYIESGFGPRCKEYAEGCPCCEEWKYFDEYLAKLVK